MAWTETSIPDQSGRTFLVTGANSGLGLETARALAQRGAHVLLAARNPEKGSAAVDRIIATGPAGSVEFVELDLADLDAVAATAKSVLANRDSLDGLINNAGIMATPYGTTAQGFEQQFGTNHLGHFALTGHLLPLLLATDGSRVVNVSSNGHRGGKPDFTLPSEQDYSPWQAYFNSKLANLLFTSELQRRLAASGSSTLAVAAHPGASSTNLGHENPGGLINTAMSLFKPVFTVFAQSAAMGALPTLMAATDPEVLGNEYYGPGGFQEFRGHPQAVGRSGAASDAASARELWDLSEEFTGVTYESLGEPSD